jgi:acyl carrier protein
MNENMEDRVRKIIADVLGMDLSEVGPDFSHRDTDRWDSLKHMEIVTAVEQAFSVTLMVDEMTLMTSVKDIVNVLEEKNK